MRKRDFYISTEWEDVRQRAFARSSVCEKCADTRDLTVHHKTYENFGGNELADDLEVLCWRCHLDDHEAEEKFWVSLVNAIESLEQEAENINSESRRGWSSVWYLGIQNRKQYLAELYSDLKKRRIMRGYEGPIGIHECHLCVNNLKTYPYCKVRGKYGCVPSK